MPFCLLSIWCRAGYVHKHKGFCVLVCVVVSCCIAVCIASALCGAMGHWNGTPHREEGSAILTLPAPRQIETYRDLCILTHIFLCLFLYFGLRLLIAPSHGCTHVSAILAGETPHSLVRLWGVFSCSLQGPHPPCICRCSLV